MNYRWFQWPKVTQFVNTIAESIGNKRVSNRCMLLFLCRISILNESMEKSFTLSRLLQIASSAKLWNTNKFD